MLIIVYIVIFEYELFVVLKNKLYDFVIFHRSGVLLFSYNFEEQREIDDSILKGSILIGINHILSNFINKKDKLSLIKMKDRDIIFEYNSEYGYAILMIVDHRNRTIERAVKLFMNEFSEHHEKVLTKINQHSQLIDTSEFKSTKLIIDNYFKPFLK